MRKLLAILFSTILIFPPEASASEKYYPEIFNWVKQQMKIDEDYSSPLIQMVSQKRLQEIFKESNQKAFQSWREEYGPTKAQKMIDMYLKELIGLFDPKTRNIYVGEFMNKCKRNSIIAHEMTHDLQEKQGILNHLPEDDKHFFRELQAEKIQREYIRQFCE